MINQKLSLKNVRVHNLHAVDLELDHNQLIVFTGVSGSGKSSLAFDTLYVEGQRRYVESLSTFAGRYMGKMGKPDVEHLSGLTPTISVEQKSAGHNPRSTVGTMTEIYDYLRVLFARVATPHCPVSGEPVAPQSSERIIRRVQELPEGSKLLVLAPFAKGKKGEFRDDFQELLRKGFMRARVDGEIVDLSQTIELDGNLAHDVDIVIDRLVVDGRSRSRIAEAVTSALELGGGICSTYDVTSEEETLFSVHAYSPASGLSYTALEPQDFSFNTPRGMCSNCQGLGRVTTFDLDKVIDPDLSIAKDCSSIASSCDTVRFGNIYRNLAELYSFKLTTPWKKLSEVAKNVFLYGIDKKWTRMTFVHPTKGTQWTDYVNWRGVLHEAQTRLNESKSPHYRRRMQQLMTEQQCPECCGARLKAYPAAALLEGKKIHQIASLTVSDCLDFFQSLHLTSSDQVIAEELLKEITQRLTFLLDVGLHYLALDRTAPTLSGGEAQRVRLASQIGCGLVGVTYILDEPSIGLHPRDNQKLLSALKQLRDRGNTVIVVEHDEETMWAADRVVDFGPGAGTRGGRILVNGSIKKLLQTKRSVTGAYLRGDRTISVPAERRKLLPEKLVIKKPTHHNLKGDSITIPLGGLIAVTGVSGSGKSSLVTDILHPVLSNHHHGGEHPVGAHKTIQGIDNVDKVIAIDQTPIGRNPRSNPSTYIKVFDEIRDLFSQLPESRARGYSPGRFSFNVKEGSCQQCSGMGQIRVDMDFMEAAWLECPGCRGRRFDQETLSVLFKGKSIDDVLNMEIGEASKFFDKLPSIRKKLDTLVQVGMEYIKLGQPSTTLSGGEAQRIKLAKELVRPATGRTLYILDEPTTGLHFHDIQHLLNVLHALVDRGNTVLVIEHNMDVVKTADWIIDLGPEGGVGGGCLVGSGKPEAIAAMDTPSGRAIKQALDHDPKKLAAHHLKAPALKPKKSSASHIRHITVSDASHNNLKQVSATIPRGKITVCSGPSGSGKTSFALDTVYAEGQRRYTESLSPYARQFVKQMAKPTVGQVEGLSPAIAIEQKAHAGNPRSTVGTMTEVYDYLRILYARLGTPHCPETGEVIKAMSKETVVDRILSWPEGDAITVLAPITLRKSDRFEEVISRFQRQGFLRIRLNGTIHRLDEEIAFDRRRKNQIYLVIDRLKVDTTAKMRLFEAVESAADIGDGQLTLLHQDKEIPCNLTFAVESTGKSYPEITPHTFAFNTPEGMCQDCQGLGYQYGANFHANPTIMDLSVAELFFGLWGSDFDPDVEDALDVMLDEEGVDLDDSLGELSSDAWQLLMNGSGEKSYNCPGGLCFTWPGIHHVLAKASRSARSKIRQSVITVLDEATCNSCEGTRLHPLARHVTINELGLGELCSQPLTDVLTFLKKLKPTAEQQHVLEEVIKQLQARLEFLIDVGLHYLALNRKAPSLSGGEAQRIRLARQLGSGLTGVLYVLDEPTIGLHPRDNAKLNQAIARLKDLGNTILMVEHDPLTVETADYLLDFGPRSGAHGGHITARGTLKQIMRNKASLTGQYLSRKKEIPLPETRRSSKSYLSLSNASAHNLKNIDVQFPLGTLTCLTGVSGSGKSTLIHEVLAPMVRRGIHRQDKIQHAGAILTGIDQVDQLLVIDQNPIGHTARSNVGTYVDILTPMRDLFAAMPEAKTRGLQPKHFSYNHRKGMCTACWGMGYKKVEMHFLPPIRVKCEECQGLRLNPVSLEVTYAGLNFGRYFDTTIDEARNIFQNIPRIKRGLDTLISVGLGYLKLGQQMATLSGGEAQRIKLSRELAKRSTGKTLYLLDEPTTGLHYDDIAQLLNVFHRLIDKGNTFIVIEHNLDLIKCADHVIELGPEAGELGGEVVASTLLQ